MNQVLSQRVLYSIDPEARGRINAVYMTVVFIGGAAGSGLAAVSYAQGGWEATCGIGAALAAMAFLLFLSEPRDAARGRSER